MKVLQISTLAPYHANNKLLDIKKKIFIPTVIEKCFINCYLYARQLLTIMGALMNMKFLPLIPQSGREYRKNAPVTIY